MSERINIHAEIFALCERLNLQPDDVGEIIFRPGDVRATVFKRDEHGKVYRGVDGDLVRESLTFEVTT